MAPDLRFQNVVEGAFKSRIRSRCEEDERHDENRRIQYILVFIRLAVEAFLGATWTTGCFRSSRL